jgi:hypothetical protein
MGKQLYFVFDKLIGKKLYFVSMNLFDELYFAFDELMGKEYIGKKIIA